MATGGVANLYKPAGASSARYVYRLRRILGERRVGHAGALDPFADGVLIACVGTATRLVERLMGLCKVYEATLRLGVTNDSFDPETPVSPVAEARAPSRGDVEREAAAMTGEIEQTPPAYSAVKVSGRPAYALARQGAAVALRPRPVRIDRIEVIDYDYPRLRLRVRCGRGTYIRALVRDLGARWGCGAICETLTRIRVGPFEAAAAVHLRTASNEDVRSKLISVDEAQARIREWLEAGEAEAAIVNCGLRVRRETGMDEGARR